MPYSFYTDRKWRVTQAEPDSKCQPGTLIKFEGTPDQVNISCNGQTPYLEGVYLDGFNRIERADDYEIHVLSENPLPLTISFTAKGSTDSGGSWTAEDNTP